MQISIKQDKSGNGIIPVAVALTIDYKKSYMETMMIRNNQIVRIKQGYIKQLQPQWYKDAMGVVRNQRAAK